MFFKNL